jgi:monoamine oxidase
MSIDRRRFLRSALALPIAALPSAVRQRDAGSAAPIVVVGAGLAGLRAAALLRAAGRPVLVLEARGAPGGRVRTIRTVFSDGLYAEAGAIRIPGMHETVLQLAKDHRLDLVPFGFSTGASLVTVKGTTVRSPGGLSDAGSRLALRPEESGLSQGTLLQRYVGDLPADISELVPSAATYARWQSYDRITWPEWLRARGASEGAITLMTLGGESKTLSALYVLRQFALLRSTTQFFKIQGGMDRLPRAMAAALGARVRYRASVVRINRASRAVRVEYLQGGRTRRIEAARVILAIPFSTLRQIDVRPAFSSAKARVIEELPYFPATRFLLQTRSRFWEAAGLSGSARSDQPAEMWDCTYDQPGERGILGCTVGGELGDSLARKTAAETLASGIDVVAQTFPEVRAQFDKGSAMRWVLEPWSRGAFAVFHPGQMTSMMPDIARPEGRVHFAGEHTSSWMGWMEGALQSGERAAREILAEPSAYMDLRR